MSEPLHRFRVQKKKGRWLATCTVCHWFGETLFDKKHDAEKDFRAHVRAFQLEEKPTLRNAMAYVEQAAEADRAAEGPGDRRIGLRGAQIRVSKAKRRHRTPTPQLATPHVAGPPVPLNNPAPPRTPEPQVEEVSMATPKATPKHPRGTYTRAVVRYLDRHVGQRITGKDLADYFRVEYPDVELKSWQATLAGVSKRLGSALPRIASGTYYFNGFESSVQRLVIHQEVGAIPEPVAAETTQAPAPAGIEPDVALAAAPEAKLGRVYEELALTPDGILVLRRDDGEVVVATLKR